MSYHHDILFDFVIVLSIIILETSVLKEDKFVSATLNLFNVLFIKTPVSIDDASIIKDFKIGQGKLLSFFSPTVLS